MIVSFWTRPEGLRRILGVWQCVETKNVGHVAKGRKILDAPPRGCEEFMTRRKGGARILDV